MAAPLIAVHQLSKRYMIGHQRDPRDGFRHAAEDFFRNPLGWIRQSQQRKSESQEEFWALKDISFEVNQGDAVGIIGRNGAGKSTLLKILSRITEPTTGRVKLKGRVASLLEVGTGFHQELTGRENIYLNGAILGMSRLEIKRKFDEIVAFSEVEKFLDTPVKRYSSGMYVRLAFAVAAHLEPEILIVDEVLAVGDAAFQEKCLGKMSEVTHGGRTVLFVSHNMPAVQTLCSKAVYLQEGRVKAVGKVQPLVRDYLADGNLERVQGVIENTPLGDDLTLKRLTFTPNPVTSGKELHFDLEFHATRSSTLDELALLLFTPQNVRAAIVDFRPFGMPIRFNPGEVKRIAGKISSLPFVDGNYSAGVFARTGNYAVNALDLASVTVQMPETNGAHAPYGVEHRGIVELGVQASVSA